MTIKKTISQLEQLIQKKFPHFDGKRYSKRQNNYIHLGLGKSLFSFDDYKHYLTEIDEFLTENLKTEFKSINPPKLVISTKWKHDYIVRSRNS